MTSKYSHFALIIGILMISSWISGCVTPASVTTLVNLNREKYVCKIDPHQFEQYRGKRILLSTIVDESKNTSNLYFYNPEQTVGYQLYYNENSMPQPVVSFFWYALQKGFDCAGLTIEERGPIYDAELALIFKSLTDEEIQFTADLVKKGTAVYTKHYEVKIPKADTKKTDVLEKRAYSMLDSTVATILGDPEFQKAVFTNPQPPLTGSAGYESIKGMILKNGVIVKGKILSVNANEVQIQSADGTVQTYQMDKDVEMMLLTD